MPLIITGLTAIIIVVAIAIRRNHRLIFLLSLAGLGAALFSIFPVLSSVPQRVTLLFTVDRFGLFYTGLIIASTFVVCLLSYDYMNLHLENLEEYYLLLLLATVGAIVITVATHFVSFFIGLEILSVSLYTLIAYQRMDMRHIEGGFKYLILSMVASSFLLFGIALIYMRTGAMDFSEVAHVLQGSKDLAATAGTVMVVVAIGFKLALVPFHMWAPDVFEGSSSPVAAFLATCSKGALFAIMLRYFSSIKMGDNTPLAMILTLIAVASMFAGNLLALFEDNLKRLLAYSSIAHFGYLLVAFLSTGSLKGLAVAYYLVAYFVSILGAFGVVTVLSGRARDADTIEDYYGLSSEHPWLAGILTASLLSLAGIPLSAGFMGKFYVMSAGIQANLWFLVIILVVNSALGLFYYLRIIAAMYVLPPGRRLSRAPALMGTVVLTALFLLILLLGVYPASVTGFMETVALR